MVSDFLSRLEQLLPIPDLPQVATLMRSPGSCLFELYEYVSSASAANLLLPVSQTAAWLTETAAVSEDFEHNLSDPFGLKTLLLHHRELGTISSGELDGAGGENSYETRGNVSISLKGYFGSGLLPFFLNS